MKITLDDLLKYREERYKSSIDLIARKGHDYNRKFIDDNHLFNLFASEILRIVDKAETGIAVRLMDKMMRIFSLMGEALAEQVKDEKLEQTIDDAHNYLDYIGVIVRKRQLGFVHLAETSISQPKDRVVEYGAGGRYTAELVNFICKTCGHDSYSHDKISHYSQCSCSKLVAD